jgi:hypothetical protein
MMQDAEYARIGAFAPPEVPPPEDAPQEDAQLIPVNIDNFVI